MLFSRFCPSDICLKTYYQENVEDNIYAFILLKSALKFSQY